MSVKSVGAVELPDSAGAGVFDCHIQAPAVPTVREELIMGDKGKKDKDKSQKQKQKKLNQAAKIALDKQPVKLA